MTEDTAHDQLLVSGDAADHVVEARQRARIMLGGEGHLGAVDVWRWALVNAGDAVILVWVIWVALQGFGDPPFTGVMLVAMAIALALLFGAPSLLPSMRCACYERARCSTSCDRRRQHLRSVSLCKR